MAAPATNRRREPGKAGNDLLIFGVAVTAIVTVEIVWVAVGAGSRIDGVNAGLARDPFEIISGLVRGRVVWPASGTVIVVAAGILLLAIAAWVLWVRAGARKGRTSVDHAARFMETPRELAHMMQKGAVKTSASTETPGSPSGRCLLAGRRCLRRLRT